MPHQHRFVFSRRARALAVVGAAGLALGACGGAAATRSSAGASGSSTSTTSGSAATSSSTSSTSTTAPPTSSTTASTSGAPSSSTGPSGPVGGTGSSLPTNGGVEACTTAHLSLSLGQSEGTAGSLVLPLVFTNTGAVPCELYGYPGVSVVKSPSGPEVGTAAQRDPAATPAVVTIAPQGTAAAPLQIALAGNYPSARCQPTSASGLSVYPPGSTTSLYVALAHLSGCAASGVDILTVQPVAGASGTSGPSGSG